MISPISKPFCMASAVFLFILSICFVRPYCSLPSLGLCFFAYNVYIRENVVHMV